MTLLEESFLLPAPLIVTRPLTWPVVGAGAERLVTGSVVALASVADAGVASGLGFLAEAGVGSSFG